MWQRIKNHPSWDRIAIIAMAVITLVCWICIVSYLSSGVANFTQYIIGMVE